jgi:ubiquinone/menaquinone biosynthesis C-methylase UbiE
MMTETGSARAARDHGGGSVRGDRIERVMSDRPTDTTSLFTGRAGYYQRTRPGYPDAVIDLLAREAGWTPSSVVADVGSGTGIFASMLLARGNTVFAVEPNAEMRAAAERALVGNPRFHGVDGSAERTTLPDASADLVTCATSFHWFDAAAARPEFRRVLAPGGFVVLLWNVRRATAPGFMAAYEQLLHRLEPGYTDRAARDEKAVDHIRAFFAPMPFAQQAFENPQPLDLEGLKGRFASASYAPLPGHPHFEPAMRALEAIHAEHARDGVVGVVYDTFVYWGRL